MHPQLSRLTAAFIIGLAVATVPGIAGPRAGGREGTARVTTRGGLQRLGASEAVAHGHDDTDPDVVTTGTPASDPTAVRDARPTPGLAPAVTIVVPPPADSIRLDAPPPVAPRTTDAVLRPLGRAPPAR